MAKRTKLTVTVYNVKRAASSNLGNPRYSFQTDHGRFRTAPNAGCAYAVTNVFTVDMQGLDLYTTLTLDGYGNVIDFHVDCAGVGGTNDPRCGRMIGHTGPCDWKD